MRRMDFLHDENDEDDDDRSSDISKDSDDDICLSHHHSHRLCSRYASCNNQAHHSSRSVSPILTRSSNSSKPIRGDTRLVDGQPEHRQRFNGHRWVRLCRVEHCSLYLTGGKFYKHWLCRQHYNLDTNENSDTEQNLNLTRDQRKRRPSPKLTKFQQRIVSEPNPKRGDIRVEIDGNRFKFNGQSWRPVCSTENCKCLANSRGFCHRHDSKKSKKRVKLLSKKMNRSRTSTASIEYPTVNSQRSTFVPVRTTIDQLKKGDIQLVRQQWNGTKWYSLCHHPSGDCTRRSAGMKYLHLCSFHYDELKRQKQIRTAPASINLERSDQLNSTGQTQTVHSLTISSTNSTMPRSEQVVQTDITFSVDDQDYQNACIFVDETNPNLSSSTHCSPSIPIKMEKHNEVNVQRISASQYNSVYYPICDFKVELNKIDPL